MNNEKKKYIRSKLLKFVKKLELFFKKYFIKFQKYQFLVHSKLFK